MGFYDNKETIGRRYQIYRLLGEVKDHGPTTAFDLAEETGVHEKTVRRHLREAWMLDILHISDWDRNHRMPVPVFSWGPGRDKPQPAVLTNYEKKKRSLEKQRRALEALSTAIPAR